MSNGIEQQKETLVAADLQEKAKGSGLDISPDFLETLKKSDDPKDQELYKKLLDQYTLVNGPNGYEIRPRTSSLDAQLDAYEAAYIRRVMRGITDRTPDDVRVEGERIRITFTNGIRPINLVVKGDAWSINNNAVYGKLGLNQGILAADVLCTLMEAIKADTFGEPDDLENPFYVGGDENSIAFSRSGFDSDAYVPGVGLWLEKPALKLCTNYLNQTYREQRLRDANELPPAPDAYFVSYDDGLKFGLFTLDAGGNTYLKEGMEFVDTESEDNYATQPLGTRDTIRARVAANPGQALTFDAAARGGYITHREDKLWYPTEGRDWANGVPPKADGNWATVEKPSTKEDAEAEPAEPVTPRAPGAEPEKPKGPRNEAEFISSLRGDGWKRLAKLEESGDNGKITITIPNDKTSPDYLNSRIHHFLGTDEALKEMPKPENYEVIINGNPVEWGPTDRYKDGTWVNPETKNRVLVDVGTTTIEWKKKKPEIAVAEPATVVAPPELPKEPSAAERQAKAKELEDLRKVYIALLQRDADISLAKIEADKALAAAQKEREKPTLTPKAADEALAVAEKTHGEAVKKYDADRAVLARAYGDLNPKLASVDPAYFGDAAEFSEAKAFATQLATAHSELPERIAALEKPSGDTRVADASKEGGAA